MKYTGAPLPENEEDRLKALASYAIMDTLPEEEFDSLARLASYICGTPIALITLIEAERLWHKSSVGMDAGDVARELSFCQYTLLEEGNLMEVKDSRTDDRFKNNPFVTGEPNIRFYAGHPLSTPEGLFLGALCVVDMIPRELTAEQKTGLSTIAQQVMAQMELKKRNERLKDELNELKIAQEEVQQKDSEISYLYKALNKTSITMEFDDQGYLVNANEEFLKFSGVKMEQVIGSHFSAFRPAGATMNSEEVWKQVLNGIQYTERRKGTVLNDKWFKVTYNPIHDKDGKVMRVLGIAQDITKEVNYEEGLIASKEQAEQTSQAKDEFLANMSHEIRTPMNAIIGFTDVLAKTNLDSEQQEYLNAVKVAGENLLSIINDILDLSKIESGAVTFESDRFDLWEVLRNTKHILGVKASEKLIGLELTIDPSIPKYVIGDEHRLSQILINLVGNAIKFTERGEVKINVSKKESAEHPLLLQFSIKDTGIGIPEEKLKLIFERFTQANTNTTRKYGGTGLGLNISKLLVDLQAGTIAVSSIEGVGSAFIVTIPYKLADQHQASFEETINIHAANTQKYKILLCEDNVLNQRLAMTVISQFGFDLRIANNGRLGVEKLKEETFDLVLMDLQMPEMDGYQATTVIRNELKLNTPIMAMTAHSLVGEKEKCMEVGMNDYIAKPFRQQELLDKISHLLQDIQPSGELQTPASNHSEPLTDLSYLREISGENAEFEREMIAVFLGQLPEDKKTLEDAIAARNWKAIGQIAHKMKSSLFVVGANQAIHQLNILETAAGESIPDDQLLAAAPHLMELLEACSEELREMLAAEKQ